MKQKKTIDEMSDEEYLEYLVNGLNGKVENDTTNPIDELYDWVEYNLKKNGNCYVNIYMFQRINIDRLKEDLGVDDFYITNVPSLGNNDLAGKIYWIKK